MVELKTLLAYTDTLLKIADFSDYAPNGLQVEGKKTIEKIVTGVTASQALIDAAISANADALLVHHGYFWRSEDLRIIGIKRKRIKTLLAHDLSLIAYHLPLDAHPTLGNNAQLAAKLDLEIEGRAGSDDLLFYGRLKTPQPVAQWLIQIGQVLARTPLHIEGGPDRVETVGFCTGGAQAYVEQALELGLDAFITGEISESSVHVAREGGIHFICAGHHATERYGIDALGTHLAEKYAIKHEFIDIDNPV